MCIHYTQLAGYGIINQDRAGLLRGREKRGFQCSAEFYKRALQLDLQCAFTAQGLAIVTAEDFLNPSGSLGGSAGSAEDMACHVMNVQDALEVFRKVRRSLNDPSVYINIGHVHYVRDEFDRVIEVVSVHCPSLSLCIH